MVTIVSSKSYNDNQWHQVMATFGPSGMQLYVDGVRVATRSEVTEGQQYLGYWRVGGDDLDEVAEQAVEERLHGQRGRGRDLSDGAVSQQQIDAQWQASGRTSLLPAPPADAYGAAVYADEPALYWRLGEANGTTANDSSASLSPGTYRGSGWTSGRPVRSPGRPTRRCARPARAAFVSSNAMLRGATDLFDRDLVQVDVDAGRQADRLREQPDQPTRATTDRHIYMQNDGKLVFGILSNGQQTITTRRAVQRRPVAPRRRHTVGKRHRVLRRWACGRHQPGGDGAGLQRLLAGRRGHDVGLDEPLPERHASTRPPSTRRPCPPPASPSTSRSAVAWPSISLRRRRSRRRRTIWRPSSTLGRRRMLTGRSPATPGTSVTARLRARWPTRRTRTRRRARTR